MNDVVYTVRACRYGDRESHSYIVGVFYTEIAAVVAGEAETEYRGGKYICEIIEWHMENISSKVVQSLPQD